MRIPAARVGAAACLGLAWLWAGSSAHAEDASVHRMVIYNGPARSVYYFSTGTTRGEKLTLEDLQRAENDMTLSDQLVALKRQYVSDERLLEAQRRAAQSLYLANPATYGAAGFGAATVPAATTFYDNFPFTGLSRPVPSGALTFYGNGMLASASVPLVTGAPYAGYPGLTGFGGFGGYPVSSGAAPGEAPVPSGESVLKDQVVRTMATEASPTFAAQAAQNYTAALVRARDSDRLRAGLDLSKTDNIFAGYETSKPEAVKAPEPAKGPAARVVVTLKNGDRIEGSLVREDADSVVVAAGDQEIELRKNETTSISKTRPGASAPYPHMEPSKP